MSRCRAGVIFCFLLCPTPGTAWANGSPNPGAGTEAACIGIPRTRPDQTPPDLIPLIKACVAEGDGARAFMLLSLADARAHFDAGRFKDKHAYRIAFEFSKRTIDQFFGVEQSLIGRGSADIAHNKLLNFMYCAQLRAAPPPTYEPAYMAVLFADPPKDGIGGMLKPDFDAESAWAAEAERWACASK